MKAKTVGPPVMVMVPHWALIKSIVCLTFFCRLEPATIKSVTEQLRESKPDTGSGCMFAWEFIQAIFNNHPIQPEKTGNCDRAGVNRHTRGITSRFTLISKNLRGEKSSWSCLISLYIILLVPSQYGTDPSYLLTTG